MNYSQVLPVGRCLKVALTRWPPYVAGKNPNYTGWCIDMFNVILKRLAVCHEYLEPPDGLWGATFPNGSWFGMMGMIHRREVDVAIGPFGVTLERIAVADFGQPITATDHAILYPRPQIEPELLGFIKPFTLPVWGLVLASLILVTLTALVLHILAPQNRYRRNEMPGRETQKGGEWTWLWGYKVLLSQEVRNLGGGEGATRIIAGLWMLVTLIMAEVYCSNLKAMLIVPKVKIPFDDLAGMVGQNEIPWTMAHGSIVQSFFESAFKEDPTSTMGKVWAGHAPLMRSAKAIIPTVIGGTAGMYTRHSSTYLMGLDFSQHGKCRLALTRGGYMAVQHSMGFPLGSPLRPVIDNMVYRLMEFGLMNKFISDAMINTSYCIQPPGSEGLQELRALAVGDFLGVFSLYGAGVILSALAFGGEMLMARSEEKTLN